MNNNYIMPKDKEVKVEKYLSDKKVQTLFGSKTRVKLLKLFLMHPENSYYVRELTRIAEAQINAIRRELANLIEIGLIEHNKGRNLENDLDEIKSGKVINKGIKGVARKYYRLNKDFILCEELKKLFSKLRGLTQESFSSRIQDLGDVQLLVLTGIFIKENTSEVDILIVGDIDKVKMQDLIVEFGEFMPREINYTLLTPDEYKYRKEVVDKFIYNILQNTNNIILVDKIGADK